MIGGKTRAKNELLNAPTKDMKRSNLGMTAAKATVCKTSVNY